MYITAFIIASLLPTLRGERERGFAERGVVPCGTKLKYSHVHNFWIYLRSDLALIHQGAHLCCHPPSVWRGSDIHHYIRYEIHAATPLWTLPARLSPSARSLRCACGEELYVLMSSGGFHVSSTGTTPICHWAHFALLNIRMRVSRSGSGFFSPSYFFLLALIDISYHALDEWRPLEHRCSYYKVRALISIVVWSSSDSGRC